MSDHIDRSPVPATQSRCVMCGHPDHLQLDDDLIRRRRTQAAIAQVVGVHPSAVSRHVNNHLLPNLANQTVAKGSAVSGVVEELDRLYHQAGMLMGTALGAGDLRMARDFFRERRQVLELVLRTAERATEDGLKRLLDQTAEGQDRSTEQLREDLYARFASLDKREKQRKARAEEEVERQRQEKIRLQEVDAEVDRTVTRQPAVKRSNPFG